MFLQFLSVLHTNMTKVFWNPTSCKTRTYLFYIVNSMAADIQATHKTKASATMIFTMLHWNNSLRVDKIMHCYKPNDIVMVHGIP